MHGVIIGHGGEGATGGIRERFECGAKAVIAKESADERVEDGEKDPEVGP